jgi:RimJ/RimL family protein N-acetyltransferase
VTDFSDKPVIEGDRVRLRPIVLEDAADMLADIADGEALRLTGTHATFTPDDIRRWTSTRADTVDRIDLAVVDIETGRWLGEVVVNDWDPDNRSCGFRIALTADARGRGYGTEATRLIVDYVFDEIDDPPVNRVELEVYAFNPRAITVYERVGFRPEGIRRQVLRWDGEYVDAIMMSIVRSDRRDLPTAGSDVDRAADGAVDIG